jgi:hypothetical protein
MLADGQEVGAYMFRRTLAACHLTPDDIRWMVCINQTLSFALPSSLESLIHHLPDYFVLYRTMNHSHGSSYCLGYGQVLLACCLINGLHMCIHHQDLRLM